MSNKTNKNLIMIIIAVAVVLVVSGFFGFGYRMMGGYNNYGIIGGFGYGFMLINWIFSILVICLVIAGIYWLIQHTKKYKLN